MPDSDLGKLRWELEDVTESINDQLDLLEEPDPDWVRRARGKKRLAKLFAFVCEEEATRRSTELPQEKQQAQAPGSSRESSKHREAKLNEVVRGLLLQQWGGNRVKAFYDRAEVIVNALVEQELKGT